LFSAGCSRHPASRPAGHIAMIPFVLLMRRPRGGTGQVMVGD
jgi:hypothetical protein